MEGRRGGGLVAGQNVILGSTPKEQQVNSRRSRRQLYLLGQGILIFKQEPSYRYITARFDECEHI
jgi:hypothetical protein